MIATAFATGLLAGLFARLAVAPFARRISPKLRRQALRREAWPRFLEIGAETKAALQRLGMRRPHSPGHH